MSFEWGRIWNRGRGRDGAVREPAAAAISDGLSRTVGVSAAISPSPEGGVWGWGRICNRGRRLRRRRSGTGSSGDSGWAFPNRWVSAAIKPLPLREGFGVGSDLQPRQRPRRRRPGTGSSGDFGWLSRTLVSINAYFEPANAKKKKRFAACLLGVFHTFVYQKIGTN